MYVNPDVPFALPAIVRVKFDADFAPSAGVQPAPGGKGEAAFYKVSVIVLDYTTN